MKTAIRHIVAHTYKPLLERYLSRTRRYRYGAIVLDISPEVFHPGFFYSTELLLKYLGRLPLHEKKVLELGCGSGLISIAAAQKGAHVTASDINPVAIDFLHTNSAVNGVHLNILQSDLFAAIPEQRFDIIAINPPYYKKQAVTAKDHAWFCGEHGEYFSVLFDKLARYMHEESEVLMVLFDGCDMNMIRGFAKQNNFSLNCVQRKRNLLETNFIYKIETTYA